MVYKGRIRLCSYKNEYFGPTAHLPASTIWFQNDKLLTILKEKWANAIAFTRWIFYQRVKIVKDSALLTDFAIKVTATKKTRFEVLQNVNCFCNEQLPHHKTQYGILVRCQGGFSTQTCLTEDRNVSDNPKVGGKPSSLKVTPLNTVVFRSKKRKSLNSGNVKQFFDQSWSNKFGTFDLPAQFNSKMIKYVKVCKVCKVCKM